MSQTSHAFNRGRQLVSFRLKNRLLVPTNIYITSVESQPAVKSSGLNAQSSWGRAFEFNFLRLIVDRSVHLWVDLQSGDYFLLQTSQLRILHSSEDNLSYFNPKIACLCQTMRLTTTNVYIARARCESQLAVKSSGLNAHSSWGPAIEFQLFFSLILYSSI